MSVETPRCKAMRLPLPHLGETEPQPCSQIAREGPYCWTHNPRRAEEREFRARDRRLEDARKLSLEDLEQLVREKRDGS